MTASSELELFSVYLQFHNSVRTTLLYEHNLVGIPLVKWLQSNNRSMLQRLFSFIEFELESKAVEYRYNIKISIDVDYMYW